MMEIGCKCDEGYGLPHSHIGQRNVYEMSNGTTIFLDEATVRLNLARTNQWKLLRVEPPRIRMWIDWKKVVEEISRADR